GAASVASYLGRFVPGSRRRHPGQRHGCGRRAGGGIVATVGAVTSIPGEQSKGVLIRSAQGFVAVGGFVARIPEASAGVDMGSAFDDVGARSVLGVVSSG